ncbi:uncharacterized protein LOC116294094 [Actinia tenebrosa]|uniref:Uncharacterized protein LOC116294094 n=1 Tax=Actinia tenebrosa TaxID=6105 RepID=A0A6P8HXT8_ACTTE|nr:uncharacterized protein LOC116294094 [Actinia tenebrosa]
MVFAIKMSAKGYESDEDDKPKTFEVIEVFAKGEDRFVYEPLGIVYRDPRDDGFQAERGYIVDTISTKAGDEITLIMNTTMKARVAKITRKGPNDYVVDKEHDVYSKTVDINCRAKKTTRIRNNRGRRRGGSNQNHA